MNYYVFVPDYCLISFLLREYCKPNIFPKELILMIIDLYIKSKCKDVKLSCGFNHTTFCIGEKLYSFGYNNCGQLGHDGNDVDLVDIDDGPIIAISNGTAYSFSVDRK